MKNRLVTACIVISALVSASGLAYFLHPSVMPVSIAGAAAKKPLALQGSLEGFAPGAQVSYTVIPEQGKLERGEATVDAAGKLKIPDFNMYNAAGKYLAYNLEINENDKKPVNVVLTFNAQDGTISVQGKGLEQFSGVSYKDSIMTRADWAGIIQSPGAGHLNDLGTEQGFKVALYDNNIMSDVPKQNPKIIQVLAAPGGGLFTDPMLNQYSFPYGCNDGIDPGPDYSFCDEDKMDDQIQKIVDNYVTALYMMGEQLTAVMAMQMLPVGAFIDAKMQLETQRELQRLTAEAHKDYHPGELMCEFGSMVKSITSAEDKAAYEKVAINDIMNGFYYDLEHTSGAESYSGDVESRIGQFRKVYCDPHDNNDGLHFMCDHDQAIGGPEGGTDKNRLNKDIDYTRTLDRPLTLDIDYAYAHTSPPNPRAATADEEDVIALAKNLYWPRVLSVPPPKQAKEIYSKYLNGRQLYAMTNVAHNSLASIAGMKSKTVPGIGANSGWNFMKSMMRNFGLTDAEIDQTLGEYPSYYAQMEVLTKKMYQQPDFYTNLYDKPVNVKRINATMEAIQIMQDRDFYESALRREMLTSLLVEEALAKHVDEINGRVVSDIKNLERR